MTIEHYVLLAVSLLLLLSLDRIVSAIREAASATRRVSDMRLQLKSINRKLRKIVQEAKAWRKEQEERES